MINLLIFIVTTLFVVFMTFLSDWLLYKYRGSAKKDHNNSPIVTGPADAMSQRIIDLSQTKQDQKKNSKH